MRGIILDILISTKKSPSSIIEYDLGLYYYRVLKVEGKYYRKSKKNYICASNNL